MTYLISHRNKLHKLTCTIQLIQSTPHNICSFLPVVVALLEENVFSEISYTNVHSNMIFKEICRNHTNSFRGVTKMIHASLASLVWTLKEFSTSFNTNWKIIKKLTTTITKHLNVLFGLRALPITNM